MWAFGNRDRREVSPSTAQSQIIPPLLCALAALFGTSAAFAQQTNSKSDTTALDEWVQNARDDAMQNGIQISLDHFNFDPTYLRWGQDISLNDLQTATTQRNYSALLVSNYSDQLESATTAMSAAVLWYMTSRAN